METLIGYIPYIVAVGSLIWLINLAFKRKANGARIAVICFVIAVGWISLAVLYVSGFDFVLGQSIFYISNIVILTLYIIVRNRALPAKTPVSSPAENVPENTGGSPPTARTPPATRQFSVDAAVATPCGLDASGIDTVRCSKCGTVQRSDRKVCYSCGEQFIFSKDNAARKESLEAESDKPLDAPLAPPCTPRNSRPLFLRIGVRHPPASSSKRMLPDGSGKLGKPPRSIPVSILWQNRTTLKPAKSL